MAIALRGIVFEVSSTLEVFEKRLRAEPRAFMQPHLWKCFWVRAQESYKKVRILE
jgi:hypothetical protein